MHLPMTIILDPHVHRCLLISCFLYSELITSPNASSSETLDILLNSNHLNVKRPINYQFIHTQTCIYLQLSPLRPLVSSMDSIKLYVRQIVGRVAYGMGFKGGVRLKTAVEEIWGMYIQYSNNEWDIWLCPENTHCVQNSDSEISCSSN